MDKSRFHAAPSSEETCPDHGDWCSSAEQHSRSACGCVCLAKTLPQLHLWESVSQSSQKSCFIEVPKHYFPNQNQRVKASLYSEFVSKGIIILHLNKTEWLPWSLRRISETTGWLELALWKMSSSLIAALYSFQTHARALILQTDAVMQIWPAQDQKFSGRAGNRGTGTQGKGWEAQVHSDGANIMTEYTHRVQKKAHSAQDCG